MKILKWVGIGVGLLTLTAILAFNTQQSIEYYHWRRDPGWAILSIDMNMRAREIQTKYMELVRKAKEQEEAANAANTESSITSKTKTKK